MLAFDKSDEKTLLDVSSLIDVCFLVLIYFLVAMTVIPAERDLAVGIPGESEFAKTQSPIQPVFLRIDAQGVIYSGSNESEQALDSDPSDHSLPLLSSSLALYCAAASSAGELPVIKLRVDDQANQQRVIDVLNALAAFEIETVAFEDFGRL